MKNSFCSLPRRGRAEVVFSLILSFGIVMALIVPGAGSNQNLPLSVASTFSLVEDDFASPIFSSVRDIRTLNGAAKQIASFAGYDDFHSRLEFDASVSVVSVTRFCGDLLSILQIDFTLRDTQHQNEACIYISEELWNFVFNRRPDVIGTIVQLHQTVYRIAGVTRSFSGFLAETDVWIPINSRNQLGAVNSMRILGSLKAGADWKTAQRTLSHLFQFRLGDVASAAGGGARLLPLNQSIRFEQELPSVAIANESDPMHGLGFAYQPAAFPFRRGS